MEKISQLEKIPELSFAKYAPEVIKALSNLPRTGWVMRGVENPESVQDHILRLREIGFSLPIPETDKKELLDMLEVHDWPEATHGDEVIVTNDIEEKKRLKAIKFEKEHEALREICKDLGQTGNKILGLWLRFETSQDEVAKLGRQIDKYQAIEKALEYEKTQGIEVFQDFFNYAKKDVISPLLLQKLQNLEMEWSALNH